MKKELRDFLDSWPQNYIRTADIARFLKKTDDACFSIIKRALKDDYLRSICKGMYVITSQVKRMLPDEFELAPMAYQPSFVSLESALSAGGWVPERGTTTTCVTVRRATEFENYLGLFRYWRVPAQSFYLGVRRLETDTGILFQAQPWRALADFMYVRRRSWDTLEQLELDLRIHDFMAIEGDTELLKELCERYPSPRVRKNLKKFLKEILKHGKSKQ